MKDTVALLMDGSRIHVSLKSYQNDMITFQGKDDIPALLIHLGYLGFEGDEAEIVEKVHDRADNKTYHDGSALSYAIRFAYYAAQKYYTILPEIDTGKGYADLILIPSPRYPDRLEHYKGNTLLVGINYDKGIPSDDPQFKHHSCVIEEI